MNHDEQNYDADDFELELIQRIVMQGLFAALKEELEKKRNAEVYDPLAKLDLENANRFSKRASFISLVYVLIMYVLIQGGRFLGLIFLGTVFFRVIGIVGGFHTPALNALLLWTGVLSWTLLHLPPVFQFLIRIVILLVYKVDSTFKPEDDGSITIEVKPPYRMRSEEVHQRMKLFIDAGKANAVIEHNYKLLHQYVPRLVFFKLAAISMVLTGGLSWFLMLTCLLLTFIGFLVPQVQPLPMFAYATLNAFLSVAMHYFIKYVDNKISSWLAGWNDWFNRTALHGKSGSMYGDYTQGL